MGREWDSVALRDLVDISIEKIETAAIPNGGYVSTDNMIPDFGGVTFNASIPSVSKTSRFSVNDILFSNIRTYFRKLWIADRNGGCSNDVIVFRGKKHTYPKFLFYLLMDERFIQHTVQTSKRTKMPRGDKSAIMQYKANLPSLPEQKAIAHILGSLDDKIELNRQMNATLEGMAQALFKSWFIDFDPVLDNAIRAGNSIPDEFAERAKVRRVILDKNQNSELRRPNPESDKSSLHHSSFSYYHSLFPAAFQLTKEMGWIPEGWEVGHMGGHAFIEMGQSPKGETYNYNGEGIPLVNGPVEFSTYFTNKSKWTTSPTKLSSKGDLIVCVRGSTTGRFVKADDQYCLGRGVCSVRGKRSQCFVDQIFKFNIAGMLGLTTGSTFPNWSHQTIAGFEVIVPPESIIDMFDEYIAPKIERIESGFLESASLSKLRATLLPKLISGELRIPYAENLTEEAIA
jgi:type I restriction enzyme, S subunit